MTLARVPGRLWLPPAFSSTPQSSDGCGAGHFSWAVGASETRSRRFLSRYFSPVFLSRFPEVGQRMEVLALGPQPTPPTQGRAAATRVRFRSSAVSSLTATTQTRRKRGYLGECADAAQPCRFCRRDAEVKCGSSAGEALWS